MLESLEQPLSRSWERRGSGDGGAVVPLLFRGKGGMSPRCHRFTFHLITFKWVNQIALTETKDLKHFRAFFFRGHPLERTLQVRKTFHHCSQNPRCKVLLSFKVLARFIQWMFLLG